MLVAALAAAALTATNPVRIDAPPIPATTLDPNLHEALAAAANADVIIAEADRFERLTVPVTIRGEGPYRFIVDTGSQATAVTNVVTDALALEPVGNAIIVATGSRVAAPIVAIDGLEFASRSFDGLRAPILNRQHLGADGIIGLDSLQGLQVLIDFRDDTIRVIDAQIEAAPAASDFEIVVRARRRFGQMVITDARIDGVRCAVIIDTGAWSSIGNRQLQRSLRSQDTAQFTSTDVNGATVLSDRGQARELRFGPVVLTGPAIGFSDSPVFAALGLDDRPTLMLGIGALRGFERVAIDFAQRRIMFDLPADTPRIRRGAGRRFGP